jgi:acetoin utilization protein AcuA
MGGRRPQHEILLETGRGRLAVRAFCRAAEIRQLVFDPQFGTHAHYRSLYTRRESLESKAEAEDANVVLAVAEGGRIVGFAVLAYPDPDERWSRLAPRVMMEVNAIEVSRDWRHQRIAGSLVRMMMIHPLIEEKIAYFVGYSWTWDLDGNRMSAPEYRRMMERLFEPFGFVEYQTNEPNICLKPENIFMGRIGRDVPAETQNRFKWLRFGLEP